MNLVKRCLVLLVTVTWVSSLTVYRSEEHLAYEEQGQNRPRQQRGEDSNLATPGQRNPYLEQDQGHTPAYFTNIHEDGGHTLGYTSYVQHHGDQDGSHDGSMEIKKLVPKSTVQVEMFHNGQDQQQQQQHQPTASPQVHTIKPRVNKYKYKPPKNYHDVLGKYKKGRRVPHSSTTNSIDSTTPSYPIVAAGISKYKSTLSPSTKKPYFGQEDSFNTLQPFQVAGDSQNKPRWKPLSDGVEIASSDEFKPKAKTRHPKEVSDALYSTQSEFLAGPERFKAERFDHDKALKGSTSFSFSNAITFGATPEPANGEEVKQTTLIGGSAFNIAHSQDIAKAVEAQLLGTAKGPIQFETGPPLHLPKRNVVHAGGLNIPVMTEEEFERHFGRHSLEAYKKQEQKSQPQLPKPNRYPLDTRSKRQQRLQRGQQQQKQLHQKGQAQSFSQMSTGSNIFAQSASQMSPTYQPFLPQQYSSGNVDLFPSLSFTVPQAKNLSLSSDRDGKVLAEEASVPQQYSVSASYQVDRGIGMQ